MRLKKIRVFFILLCLSLALASLPKAVNAIPLYEDFTTYTEVDPTGEGAESGHIQFTANHVDFECWRNEDAYLYFDKGINHFGEFEHLIDAKITDPAPTYNDLFAFYCLANAVDDIVGLATANEPLICIYFKKDSGGQYLTFAIFDGSGWASANSKDQGVYWVTNTMYYFKVRRDATNNICKVYDDSERTNLLWTGIVPLATRDAGLLRYIFPATTYNSGAIYGLEGDIENLELKEFCEVTFYNNSGGILKVNGVTIPNETSKIYPPNEIIELSGLPINSSYTFQNFTWDSNYNKTNPHNLTVTSDLTVWCYFGEIPTVRDRLMIGIMYGTTGGFIIGITLLVLAASRMRSENEE